MGTAKGSSALVSTLTSTTFQRSPLRSMKDPGSGTDLSPSMSRSLSSVLGSPLYRNTICLAALIPSLLYCPTIRVFCPAGLSAQSRFINQPVRNLFPVMIVGIVHRAQKLGLEFVSKNRNVAGGAVSSLMLASMLDDRSGNTYPIVGLATAYDVVVNFLGL